MKTVTLCECAKCFKVIEKETDGVIIQGNIYVANPTERGGLIGNNFPLTSETFAIADIGETAYCKKCMAEILKL